MRQILKYTYNFFLIWRVWTSEMSLLLPAGMHTNFFSAALLFSCHAIVSDSNPVRVCSISVCCSELFIWQFYLRSAAHAVLTSSKMPSWILRWYHLDYNFFLVYLLELSDNRHLQWLELYIISAVYILFVVRFCLI